MQGPPTQRASLTGERPPPLRPPPPPVDVRVPRKPRPPPPVQLDTRASPRTLPPSGARVAEPSAPLPQGRGPSPPPVPRTRRSSATKLAASSSSVIPNSRASPSDEPTPSIPLRQAPPHDSPLVKLERVTLDTRRLTEAVQVLSGPNFPPVQELEAFVEQLFLLTFCCVSEAEYLAWQPRSVKHAKVDKRRLLGTLPPRNEVIKYGTIRRSAQSYFDVDMKEVSGALRKIVTLVHDSMSEMEILHDPSPGMPLAGSGANTTVSPMGGSPTGRPNSTSSGGPGNRSPYRHDRIYSPSGGPSRTQGRYSTPPPQRQGKYMPRRDPGGNEQAGGQEFNLRTGSRITTATGGDNDVSGSWYLKSRYAPRDSSPPPVLLSHDSSRRMSDVQQSDSHAGLRGENPRYRGGGPRGRGPSRGGIDRRSMNIPSPREGGNKPSSRLGSEDRRGPMPLSHDHLVPTTSPVPSVAGPQQPSSVPLTNPGPASLSGNKRPLPDVSSRPGASPLVLPAVSSGGPGSQAAPVPTTRTDRQWPEAVLDCRVPTGSRVLGAIQEKSYHQLGVKRTWSDAQRWVTSFELDDDDLSDVDDDQDDARISTAEIPPGRRVISCKEVAFPVSEYGSSEAARMAAEAFTFKIDKAVQCDFVGDHFFAGADLKEPTESPFSGSTLAADAASGGNHRESVTARATEPAPGRQSKRLRVARVLHSITPPNWRPNSVWNPAAHCATCTCPNCNEVSASMHCRTCVCKLPTTEQRQLLSVAAAQSAVSSGSPATNSTASTTSTNRRMIRNGPDVAVKNLLRSNSRWDSWLQNLFDATSG